MHSEERLIGSVSGKTYISYVLMGNAWLNVPLLVASISSYLPGIEHCLAAMAELVARQPIHVIVRQGIYGSLRGAWHREVAGPVLHECNFCPLLLLVLQQASPRGHIQGATRARFPL